MSRIKTDKLDFSGLNSLKAALVPFIQLDFNGFSTGCIPPKYISSFSASRVRDMTGTYNLQLIYAPDTFAKGDDVLGIKLAQCMQVLGGESNSDTELQVNAKLTYGWVGGEKITFKQAVINEFHESLDDGVVTYQIGGVLGPAVKNAMKTSLDKESFYDINDDGELNALDYIYADDILTEGDNELSDANNDFIRDILGTLNSTYDGEKTRIMSKIAANKIPAGWRLSDVIEVLAKYVFRGVYTVVVDHNDYVYDEDTEFTAIVTDGYKITEGETMLQKLQKLVSICYSVKDYTYSFIYTGKSGTSVDGKVYTFDVSNENDANQELMFKAQEEGFAEDLRDAGYISDTYHESARAKDAHELFDISHEVTGFTRGSQYEMIYVDNKYKNSLPLIKIGTDASIYSGSQLGHYTISNTNKNNTVISCSFSANLIPMVTAFGQTLNKSDGIDIENGEIVSLTAPSLPASLSREKMLDYAEQLALKLESHINSINQVDLTVLFDGNSVVFGIDDNIHITNKINGGNSLYDGRYYIEEMSDSLDGGLLTTTYKLLYEESQVHEYMSNYIFNLLAELNPDTTIT